jgi:hypothetical protein
MGEVLAESMAAFASVTFLVFMFIVVFTILGLHIFGDLHLDIVNPNFNTFMNSFVTVFQVCLVCCEPRGGEECRPASRLHRMRQIAELMSA